LARSLILFDGVNELPSEAARSQLMDFRRNHPKVPMIFTTRDLSLGGDLGIERKLEMQPLTETQMQAFIRAYIPDQAEAMLRQLKERLREFGQTPLLLWMLCEVFQQAPDNQLPSNLGGVFQAFTQMYEASSVRKHEVALLKGDVRPLSDRRLWKKALMAIAAIMMQGETPVDFRVAIHRDEAETELSRIFPSEKFPVRDILDDLLKYHLLQNRSADQIEFRHQLLQEYYAAESLLRQLPTLTDTQLKQDYLNYLKWTEPVALMLALVDQPLAVQVVRSALDVDLMLGARLAGAVKREFQAETVGLVNKLIDEKNLPEWLKVELWGKTRSDVVRPEMLQALNSQNIEITRTAAAFIGQTSDQTTVGLLTKRLEEIDTSFFAQTSFGGNDQTGTIWTMHVEALAYISPQTAIEFLRKRLIDQPDKRTVLSLFTHASELLMKLDGESILPILIEDLSNFQYEQSKNQNNPFGWELTPQRIKQIKEASGEKQKFYTLNLIGYANNYDSIIPNLVEILAQEKSESLQKRIIQLIGQSSNELVNQILVGLLSHKTFEVRKESGVQLIKRKIEETDDIEKLLAHENWDTACSAAIVLGNLGFRSALPFLCNAIRNIETSMLSEQSDAFEQYRQTAIRLTAVEASDSSHNDESISCLIDSLRAADQEFREMEIRLLITKALGSINDDESTLCLLNILYTDDNLYVRREAAFSLSNLGRREAVPELLIALNEGGLDGRANGIRSLAKLDIEEPLWNILQEKAVGWQTAAVELAKLGKAAEVLPDLRQALVDLGEESSNEVIDLLSKLADSDTCKWLVEALDNPEPHKSDQYFCNRVAFVLAECRPEIVANQLPALQKIISRNYIRQIFWLVPAIQANCKYYDYKIFRAHRAVQKGDRPNHQNRDRPCTINQFPNVTEVKIFEQVDNYHESPKDPPP
jgi:HEAT repeat protein